MAAESHLLTATINEYVKWLQDNIFNDEDRVASNKLLSGAKSKAGQKVTQQHNYAKNATAGSFNPRGTYPITNNQKITNSDHEWGTFAATIEYYDYDEAINSGGVSRIIDDLKNEFENAKMSLQDKIADSIVNGNRATAGQEYGFDGLGVAMATAANTYGGLARGTYTWYDNQRGTFTGNALNQKELRTEWRKCRNGNDAPNLILTTSAVEGYYADSLMDAQLLVNVTQTGDLAVKNLKFFGVDVEVDGNIAAGLWYNINTKYSKAYKLTGWDMKLGEKVRGTNKLSWIQPIIFGATWYLSRPNRCGVISGITS